MFHGGCIAEAALQKMGYGELIVLVLLCALTSLVLLKSLGKYTSKKAFPPGPFALPFIGHLHLLTSLPHQRIANLSKKHGPIVGLWLGQQRAVAVSSPELAKEVLVTHDKLFANRPLYDLVSTVLYGAGNEIVFSHHGPTWRKQRKICIMSLFTAKRLQELEYIRQEEIASLMLRLRQHGASSAAAEPVDVGRCIGQMAAHTLMRLLLSKATFLLGPENLPDLIKDIEHEISIPTLGDLFPNLSFLDVSRKRQMRRLHDRFDKAVSTVIAEHQQSSIPQDDLLQALLNRSAGQDASIPPQETFTHDEIKGIILDALCAGIHTTTSTLEWAMAELLTNPHCLQRLREEIDFQLGNRKQVTDADIQSLSYLRCVVKEVFRLHPVVPMLIPRISNEECKLSDYTLPANTTVFVNVWAIQRDETLWPHATKFMPERFESKDIDVKGQNFELLPFGFGRRICLGMPMALSVVHTTLANLVRNFDWELPYGETYTSINMAEASGITAAKAFPLMAIPKSRI